MRIEKRWPGLDDRLTSTVQFLHLDPSDERYGSRCFVTPRCVRLLRKRAGSTSARSWRRSLFTRPSLSRQARLPLLSVWHSSTRSPLVSRFDALHSLSEETDGRSELTSSLMSGPRLSRLSRGDSFTLGLRVKPGDLVPESARVIYRFPDGEELTEPLRSLEGGEFRGRIDTVNQPFRFSVVGGDDTTSIRDLAVQVVPPPALKNLSVRLVSPEYTGIPVQTLAPGLTQMRALEGTQVELEAEANKPLASAELRLGQDPVKQSLTFDSNRTRFQTRFPVRETRPFGLISKTMRDSRAAIRSATTSVRSRMKHRESSLTNRHRIVTSPRTRRSRFS